MRIARQSGCGSLLGQEHRDVANEALRVLVERTVAGVGVKDQLRVRNVLLEDVRVDGVDDHVVVAVDHQRWLRDGLQVLVRLLARRAPLGQGLDLRRRDLLVHLWIAVLAAQAEALPERGTGGLAGCGGIEVHVLPQQVRLGIGGAEDRCASGVSVAMPSPLRGPVPTSTRRRTSGGAARVSACVTVPPIEKPSRSHCFRPKALMKAAALAAMPSTVVGTSPELLEMPALSNRITSRIAARPSVTSGSQWSIVPVKCMLKTSGTLPGLPKRR